MDKYMILDGILQKNPTEEEINNVPIKDRIEVCKGRLPIFIFENWWLDIESGSQIDFQYREGDNVEEKRKAFFERIGKKPVSLRKLILPPDYFQENGVIIPDIFLRKEL